MKVQYVKNNVADNFLTCKRKKITNCTINGKSPTGKTTLYTSNATCRITVWTRCMDDTERDSKIVSFDIAENI